MARGKRHSPEQIVNVLRQIEVAIANGKTTPAAERVSVMRAIWFTSHVARDVTGPRSGMTKTH